MSDYKYIEATGLIIPDTSVIKDEVEAEFRAAFGADLALTPESPEGVLVAAETEARDNVVRNNAEIANQINPRHAGGVFLDAIAALTGLSRRSAEASLAVAQLAGTKGAIIPAGSRAATAEGDIFATRTPIVLDAGGKATANFYSLELDAIPAMAGTLTNIVDPVLGWETVTNAAAATLGQPVEQDSQFRKRREDTLFLQGVALTGAILSGVLDTPGVRSAIMRENYESVTKVIDGVSIPPHCLYFVVDGGADIDVAQTLFAKKSLGCGWKGKVAVDVICPKSSQTYIVRFDRPEEIAVRARITVRVLGATNLDAQTIVRQAIIDYAADRLDGLRGFQVGASVSPFELAVAVGMTAPSIFVLKAEIGLFGAALASLKSDTMPLEIWQKARSPRLASTW